MSTKSMIARETRTGYEAIYCHYDGYLSWVGEKLFHHYQDKKKIAKLFKLGYLSTLGKEIGRKHKFDNHMAEDGKYEDMCLFYKRDRGETGVDKRTLRHDINDLFKMADDMNAEYIYLFNAKGEWMFATCPFDTIASKFQPLNEKTIFIQQVKEGA